MIGDRIQDYLDEHGISYRIQNQSFSLTCPECDKKDKVNIHRTNGNYICYVCADSGKIKGSKPEYLLQKYTGESVQDIKAFLYGITYEQLSGEFKLDLEDKKREVVVNLDQTTIPMGYVHLNEPEALPGVNYLKSRGISLEVAFQYGIMYSEFVRRVLFPAYIESELVGYQARTIDLVTEENIKAISSKGNWRSSHVMFQNRLKNQKHAIVCEGPVDAIKANLLGGNIATLGKNISANQISLLKNSGVKRIYLGLDDDAYDLVPELARQFGVNIETFLIHTPEHREDLGDCTFEEVVKAANEAEKIDGNSLFLVLK